MSLFFSGRASCTRSGWRKPAVARGRAQSGNSACICNCVTKPRRADGRRSCKRAFVHRECRYFSANWRRAPGAAGVSQPWHADVLSPGTAIASATALPNHGGLTPAALVNERMCTANVVFGRIRFPGGLPVAEGGTMGYTDGESGRTHTASRASNHPMPARRATLMAKAAARLGVNDARILRVHFAGTPVAKPVAGNSDQVARLGLSKVLMANLPALLAAEQRSNAGCFSKLPTTKPMP
jgi:hypothetical protein